MVVRQHTTFSWVTSIVMDDRDISTLHCSETLINNYSMKIFQFTADLLQIITKENLSYFGIPEMCPDARNKLV